MSRRGCDSGSIRNWRAQRVHVPRGVVSRTSRPPHQCSGIHRCTFARDPTGSAKLADYTRGGQRPCEYRNLRRAPPWRAFVAQSPAQFPRRWISRMGPNGRAHGPNSGWCCGGNVPTSHPVTCARRGCPQHPSCVGVTPEPASQRGQPALEPGGPGRASPWPTMVDVRAT